MVAHPVGNENRSRCEIHHRLERLLGLWLGLLQGSECLRPQNELLMVTGAAEISNKTG